MKPQRFEIGQAVTPKVNAVWQTHNENLSFPSMDIFHISEYVDPQTAKILSGGRCRPNEWFIRLSERGEICHMESNFEAVITDSELARELESIEAPQTI